MDNSDDERLSRNVHEIASEHGLGNARSSTQRSPVLLGSRAAQADVQNWRTSENAPEEALDRVLGVAYKLQRAYRKKGKDR